MSRQILFNNATAVPAASGSVNNPFEVAEARIAAFNPEDYASGTLDLTAAYDGEFVEFVQGGKSGHPPVRTSLIKVSDVEYVKEAAYAAPVAQVTTIVPATGTGIATVRAVQVNRGFKPFPKFSTDVTITGKTKAQITDAFVALINARSPKFLTASKGGSDNLVLTADLGVSFETGLDGLATAWGISATAPNFGSGTAEQVKAFEEQAWGQHANYTQRIYLPVPPQSYAASANYDLHVIRVRTTTTRNIGGLAQKYQDIYFAIQTSATGIDLPVFFGFEDASD